MKNVFAISILGVLFLLASPVWAQNQVVQNPDGSYAVTLADGTQQAISAELAAQIEAAVAEGQSGPEIADAISALVSANPELTLAIVAFATNTRPAAASAVSFGAIVANPDAGQDIIAAAQDSGGTVHQTVISLSRTGAGEQGVLGRARLAIENPATTSPTT